MPRQPLTMFETILAVSIALIINNVIEIVAKVILMILGVIL